MKKLLLCSLAAALPIAGWASDKWTLQGKEYTVDTTYHAKIGPGTTQTSLELSGAQKLRIFYTTTDLTNPNVDLRVTKGSKKYVGCQTLSAQQKAYDRAGARYFAGVNADFFGNSAPIGSTVVDGEVINTANNGWVNWYLTADRKPHIGALGYNGTATTPGGAHAVAGINVGRGENQLIVYNKLYNGSNSGTNSYGQEVSIEPLEGTLGFSGKVRCRVTCAPLGAGSMAIPAGGYVLSGHGTGAALVAALKIGDEVTLDLYPSLPDKIWQMASGLPVILQNGVTLDTQGALDHLVALNPRTAVGHNADGTRVVLLVVDGRSTLSAGVVSRVLADIMRQVGCTEAMNFDGGGSSELYTSTFGVRNRPSDGQERAVTNAVWCVSTTPDDSQVAEISFVSPTVKLPKYGFYKPQIYGYNKYGVLVDTDVQGVTLSCPEALGHVVENGSTLFADGSGYHALTATYGGASCTVPVTIGTGEPRMRLASAVTDGFRDYRVEVVAAVDNLEMPLENKALTWSTDNAAVATVSADGLVHGVANGTANITGSVDSFTGTLPVTVSIPNSHYEDIDSARNFANWKITGTGIQNQAVADGGNSVINLSYAIKSTRGTYIALAPENGTCIGIPDSIRLVVNPGAASVSKIIVDAGPRGERGTGVALSGPFVNGDNLITLAASEFVDTTDMASYPLTLNKITFYVGGSVGAPNTIGISALQSVHNAIPAGTNGINTVTAIPAAPTQLYDLQGRPATNAPGLYLSPNQKHLRR